MKSASKAELRAEIRELRRVGQQLANVAYNAAQERQPAAPVVNDRGPTWKRLVAEWDAITRAERAG